MKSIVSIALICILVVSASAQTKGDEDEDMYNRAQHRDQRAIDEAVKGWWTASMKDHEQRVAWWRQARFGMFIHWGVYSLPGGEWKGKKVGGYAEHLMRKEKITRKEYLELAHRFNPVLFNADEWAKAAREAGMRYMIITAKHHDGFAIYPSKVSDFNIYDQTPFKRDPLAELSVACKKYGIKFGFYYSHAFDWEHPDAPGNDWEYNNPGGDLNLFGGRNWYDIHPELLPKAVKYVNEKAIPQIRELLTKYHPDIIWFDTPHKLPFSENLRILRAIREIDPQVVVNGRLARSASGNFGDYINTADRPAEFVPVTGDWEAIPTTNESYGYSKFDQSHKPVSFFIQLIAKAASRGGNLLMNIGPKGDGAIDVKDLDILAGIGKWMKGNQESIYGTSASTLPLQNWGVSTMRGDRLYLHVFQFPKDGKLYVGGLNSNVRKIYSLVDDKKIKIIAGQSGEIVLDLSGIQPDPANTVIVLELDKKPASIETFFIAPNIPLTRLLAFDAELTGKGFGFGDGKTARYYVDGWTSPGQTISWRFNTVERGSYRMVAKFIAGESAGGEYYVLLDNQRKATEVIKGSGKDDKVTDKDLGVIQIASGVHELLIRPVKIDGKELMKLLEIQLIRQ